MKRKRLFLVVVSMCLALVMVSLVAGCAAPAPSPTPTPTSTSTSTATPKPTTTPTPTPTGKVALRIGTQLAGSTSFVVGAAISKVTGTYAPNVSVDVVGLSGGEVVMKMMLAKEMDLGSDELITIYNALHGLEAFANSKVPVRLLFAGQESVYQWYTLNPKIQTLADFKGRVIEYAMQGSTGKTAIVNGTFEWLYNTYGFSLKDIKGINWTGAAKSNEDLLAGTADVSHTYGKAASALLELANRNSNLHIIPYPDACVSYITQKNPACFRTLVTKGTYGTYPPADIQTIGGRSCIYARADLSDDTIYQITKAVLDHLPEFQGILGKAVGPDFSLQNAVAYPIAPFHAGAIKYYKEKGIWTTDLEKKQAENLAALGATK